MTNPYLADTIERAGRDPLRKLAVNDRIFGTMTLSLEQGIEPVNMAIGALAGIAVLLEQVNRGKIDFAAGSCSWRELKDADIEKIIYSIWGTDHGGKYKRLVGYVKRSKKSLESLLS